MARLYNNFHRLFILIRIFYLISYKEKYWQYKFLEVFRHFLDYVFFLYILKMLLVSRARQCKLCLSK